MPTAPPMALYIPFETRMRHRLECALLRQFRMKRQVFVGTFPESKRCLSMLRRVSASMLHKRARWTFEARLENGPNIRFGWHPKTDPFESPDGAYSRAGRIMFNGSGMFFATRNGNMRRILKMKVQAVKLFLECPQPECDGDIMNRNAGTPACSECGFCFIQKTKPKKKKS